MRALGVDVGATRHDAVLLDGGEAVDLGSFSSAAGLGALLHAHRPDVVAIDGPPQFALPSRPYREAERALVARGLRAFYTPPASRAGPFHRWMRAAFGLFAAAAEAGYPLSCDLGRCAGAALEAFPHAAAVALAGHLPPPAAATGPGRHRWRRAVLAGEGVAVSFPLRAAHRTDATLAALTGQRALEGRACALGDPEEGAVVLPVPPDRLPARYGPRP